jgi:hypothetical protein
MGMRRSALLAVLLLSCATGRVASTVQPAQSQPQPQPRWTSGLRARVLLECQAHFSSDGPFCNCVTEKLEVISPDPEVEFTPNDIRAGLMACSASRPEVSEKGSERTSPGDPVTVLVL